VRAKHRIVAKKVRSLPDVLKAVLLLRSFWRALGTTKWLRADLQPEFMLLSSDGHVKSVSEIAKSFCGHGAIESVPSFSVARSGHSGADLKRA
jgi:hypothetical protein